MTSDPHARRSRRGWPIRTHTTTTSAGTHAHDLPDWLPRIVLWLAVAVLALTLTVAALLWLVLSLKASRDHETDRINDRITHGICDLLDQLPQGELLDGPRHKYGCGPGRPVADYPPDVQARLSPPPPAQEKRASRPTSAATQTSAAPAGTAPAAPSSPQPSLTGGPKPTPSPSPTPTGPLQAVCQVAGVCVQLPVKGAIP